MKKTYFQPTLKVSITQIDSYMTNGSIDSNLEHTPGQGDDDEEDAGAKGRGGLWDNGGLW